MPKMPDRPMKTHGPRPLTLAIVSALQRLGRPSTPEQIFASIDAVRPKPRDYRSTSIRPEIADFSDTLQNCNSRILHGINREFLFQRVEGDTPENSIRWALIKAIDAESDSTEVDDDNQDLLGDDPGTVIERLVKTRREQELFRRRVRKHWNSMCCLTGISDTRLLVAAHIKPWALSNYQERVDRFNGLLLSPIYDRLFDKYLITIRLNAAGTGRMAICRSVVEDTRAALRIDKKLRLAKLDPRAWPYIFHHNLEFDRRQQALLDAAQTLAD